MGKHNHRNRHGGINLTLIVQDEGWNKLATFKWNASDIRKQNYVLRTVDDAFGHKIRRKTDIDWLND